MTATAGNGAGRAGPRRGPAAAGILADRIAATLVHHEPGWRLPRLTALARRYQVSPADVDAALTELASRHLLSRLPDGQAYRASPAEYRIPLAGMAGLASYVDPMGGDLVCTQRSTSLRRPPEGVGRSLALLPGEMAAAVRCLWAVGGEPAALSISYKPERLRGAAGAGDWMLLAGDGPHPSVPVGRPPDGSTGQPRAMQIEMGLPPPSAARSLRLPAGELAAIITVSFEDPARRAPVALTVATLRPERFRIVVQAHAGDVPAESVNGFATVWTQAAADWEP